MSRIVPMTSNFKNTLILIAQHTDGNEDYLFCNLWHILHVARILQAKCDHENISTPYFTCML